MKSKKDETNATPPVPGPAKPPPPPPVHGPARPMTPPPDPVERLRQALVLSKDASLETILREAAEDIESRPLSHTRAQRYYDASRWGVLKTDAVRDTDASKPV